MGDKDGSGDVSSNEFMKMLDDENMRVYLNSLGIQASEAQGLFDLLDCDDSGSVSIDEFITGCLRLKGEARSVDVATLMYENKKLVKKFNKVERMVDSLATKADKQTAMIEDLTKKGAMRERRALTERLSNSAAKRDVS